MASRKEEKERRRQERLEQERRLHAEERRRRLYAIVGGGGLAIAALVAIVVVVAAGGGGGSGKEADSLTVPKVDPPPQQTSNLVTAAKAADCTLLNPEIEGRTHVTSPVKYKTNPPSSGNHYPVPEPDGEYGKAPPVTHLVHDLEHGRIIIQWAPSTPKRRIGQLRGLFDEDPYHLILTPNSTHMQYQVAATAWGHIAGCKRFNDKTFDVFRAFKTRYVDKAPEFVP
jgi:uncharacterized protein DUF3105